MGQSEGEPDDPRDVSSALTSAGEADLIAPDDTKYQGTRDPVARGASQGILHVGTQGWAYRDWVGVFYPPDTKPRDYLRFYSQVFKAVELDTTFYGPPRPETVRHWMEQTPEDFTFTAKMPRIITHERNLFEAEGDLVEFLTAMQAFGDKLGPIVIQMPPSFRYDAKDTLEAFLKILPEEFEYAIEFRHASWSSSSVVELLARYGIAWTIVDLHYLPVRINITSPFTYIRLLGRRSDVKRLDRIVVDRTDALDRWAKEVDRLIEQNLRVYAFINNHYAGHSPASVRDLQSRLHVPDVTNNSLHINQTVLF